MLALHRELTHLIRYRPHAEAFLDRTEGHRPTRSAGDECASRRPLDIKDDSTGLTGRLDHVVLFARLPGTEGICGVLDPPQRGAAFRCIALGADRRQRAVLSAGRTTRRITTDHCEPTGLRPAAAQRTRARFVQRLRRDHAAVSDSPDDPGKGAPRSLVVGRALLQDTFRGKGSHRGRPRSLRWTTRETVQRGECRHRTRNQSRHRRASPSSSRPLRNVAAARPKRSSSIAKPPRARNDERRSRSNVV